MEEGIKRHFSAANPTERASVRAERVTPGGGHGHACVAAAVVVTAAGVVCVCVFYLDLPGEAVGLPV
jgi:hypothetical protein